MKRLALALLLSSFGCAPGSASSSLASAPTMEQTGQATCKVKKSQLKPLVVEWSSTDRAALEARARDGLVVVRYLGCEMQVLPRCHTRQGGYHFVGVTKKTDRIAILDEDQLWANMPIGAAGLEATLQRSGQLDVSMTIVGQYESSLKQLTVDDLDGACEGATHVLASLTVGAFELSSVGKAKVGGGARIAGVGAGAESNSARETISSDGSLAACDTSTPTDTEPPSGCGALVRIEALPFGERTVRRPLCPADTHWDGQECVREKVVTHVACPAGSHLEAEGCVQTTAGTCPDDMVFVPAGSFTLASASGEATRLVEIGELCVDRTEVTAKDFLGCVKAGRCRMSKYCEVPELTDPRTNMPVQVPTTADNPKTLDHPMNCVEWKDANAYCAFAGKRLPSEAEWVWAARSGPLARLYPWGDDPPAGHACFQRARKGTCAAGSVTGDRTAQGLLDMAGNVREWTSSFSRTFPIARGGSFYDKDPAALSVAATPPLVKSHGRAQQGFRCAKWVGWSGAEARERTPLEQGTRPKPMRV